MGAASGWVLGDVQACDAPVEPAWTDASAPVYDYPAPVEVAGPEPGGVAIVEVGGARLLFWTRPVDTAAVRDLGTGAERLGASLGPSSGFTHADLDGDGHADLVHLGGRELRWAAGTDAEVTDISVPMDVDAPRDTAIGDVDGDGDLDLVFVPSMKSDATERPAAYWRPNLGDRQFGDVVPIEADPAYWGSGFEISVLDVDDDGAPDAYVCNDMGAELAPNALLRNDGAGGLSPAPDALGLDLAVSCMGTSWGDVDADGRLDAYVGASGNHHLLLASDAGFFDASAARGFTRYAPPRMPWGSSFGDLDNDGRLDLVVGSACFREPGMERFDAWWLEQADDGTFVDRAPTLGVAPASGTRGVVVTDLNDDGVLDVVLGDTLRSPWVYLSAGCTADAWLEVEGPLGSHVTVEAGGVTRAGLVTTDAGWGSSGPARLHVGLGAIDVVDRVTIRAPWSEPVVLEGPIEARRRVTFAP